MKYFPTAEITPPTQRYEATVPAVESGTMIKVTGVITKAPKEHMTPTTTEKSYVSIPEDTFTMTFDEELTSEFVELTPEVKKTIRKVTPTSFDYVTIPIKSGHIRDAYEKTATRKLVMRPRTRIMEDVVPIPATEKLPVIEKIKYMDIVLPKVDRTVKVGPIVYEIERQRKVVPTKSIRYTFAPRIIEERVQIPKIETAIHTAERRKFQIKKKLDRPEKKVFPFKPKIITEYEKPTTASKLRIPIRTDRFRQYEKRTTYKMDEVKPITKVAIQKVPAPSPIYVTRVDSFDPEPEVLPFTIAKIFHVTPKIVVEEEYNYPKLQKYIVTKPPIIILPEKIVPPSKQVIPLPDQEMMIIGPPPKPIPPKVCPEIPSAVVTKCYKIPRTESCSEDRLMIWQTKVKNCLENHLLESGTPIQEYIDKRLLHRLNEMLTQCIQEIGDTACRKNKFSLIKWISEKEIIVMGSYSEHSADHPRGIYSEAVQKCIATADDKKMDSCFPGFHTTLMDLIIFRKSKVALQIPSASSNNCLLTLFTHCDPRTVQQLEHIFYGMFGVCMKMSAGSLSPGCDPKDNVGKYYCSHFETNKYVAKMESCKNKFHHKGFSLQKKMGIMENCIKEESISCIFSTWMMFQMPFNHLIKIINSELMSNMATGRRMKRGYEKILRADIEDYNDQEDEINIQDAERETDTCAQSVTVNNLKQCGKLLVSVTSVLYDADIGSHDRASTTVTDCFAASLKECPQNFINDFLGIIGALTNSLYLRKVKTHDKSIRPPEASIKVTPNEIDICEIVPSYQFGYRSFDQNNSANFNESADEAEDLCLPIRYGDSISKVHVLQKTCRFHDISMWINKINQCISPIAEDIGLRFPQQLTISNVIKLMDSCIKGKKSNLMCRPKDIQQFRSVFGTLFTSIRRFTVTSTKENCFNQLQEINLGYCVYKLHSYFVKISEPTSSEPSKEAKAWQCFSKSLNECQEDAINVLFEIFYFVFGAPEQSPGQPDSEFVTCEPGFGYRSYDFDKTFEDCVPPEELDEEEDYRIDVNYQRNQFKAHGWTEAEYDGNDEDYEADLLYRQQAGQTEKTICTRLNYNVYLSNLFECQKLRNLVLNNNILHNCADSFEEKTFQATVQCILEEREELPCLLNSTENVKEFLFELDHMFKNNTRLMRNYCPQVKSCYSWLNKSLSTCAEVMFEQLQVLRKENHSRTPEMTFNCLNLVWPECSNISVLALPLINVPLGIGTQNTLKEDEHKMCLTAPIASDNKKICSESNRKDAVASISNCVQRIVSKLILVLSNISPSLRNINWTVDALSICVKTHPILDCIEKDLFSFETFMGDLLTSVQNHLREYLKLFESTEEVRKGTECVNAFSNNDFNQCLPLMFKFMTRYHHGQAKDSDYPGECIQDIFHVCENMDTFHTLMKKSMFISSNSEITNSVEPKITEICFSNHKDGKLLQSCTMKDFENNLGNASSCSDFEEFPFPSDKITQLIFHHCSKCILKNVDNMCYYDIRTLKEVTSKAFVEYGECLVKNNINEKCILELIEDVQNKCILYLHSFSYNVKIWAFNNAAESSRYFKNCLKRTIKSCPEHIYPVVKTLYETIAGLKLLSMNEDGD